ncbi:hypothetical protein C2W62_16670 [Candidatus Entotheonella serta]|nr:hypothetical protein C2W62_16670 [Candidatus Entotheonella serta]
MAVLLAARGFPPEYWGNGNLFLTAPRDAIQRAYIDILDWLGFANEEEYHTALSLEGAVIFRRGRAIG